MVPARLRLAFVLVLASPAALADDTLARRFCDALPHDEVPRFLTNVTLETYDQYRHGGTCMGCHARAMTAAGQDANFSFLPSRAR